MIYPEVCQPKVRLMNTLQRDIDFLKKLLEDHMEQFSAEEQNSLVNLIQKLILIRDIRNQMNNDRVKL